MKSNALKRKLYEGKTCFGTFITIGSPDVADVLKNLGFEWFVFDTEHSYFSLETARNMELALSGSDICPFIRIGEVDQYLVKRALDIGSQGILAPLVNSSEEAERLVNYAMYPPKGSRGAGPGRAADYGLDFGGYIRRANQEILIAVQIETLQALSNVEAILAVDGVDIAFVGPSDLTMSHGLSDDRSNPKIIDAMKTVVESCERAGKIPGTLAASPAEAEKFESLGFKFISLGADLKFLIAGARDFLEFQKRK